jgi:hypothetical protein
VLLCQFFNWREKGFGCTYYYVLGVPYSCGVVLFFWFWREKVFGVTYVLSVQYSCAVVSVFLLWRESFITTRKKSSSRLSGVWAIVITTGKKVLVAIIIMTGKKSSSPLSGGCAIVITTGKKSSSHDFYVKLNVSNLNVTNLY